MILSPLVSRMSMKIIGNPILFKGDPLAAITYKVKEKDVPAHLEKMIKKLEASNKISFSDIGTLKYKAIASEIKLYFKNKGELKAILWWLQHIGRILFSLKWRVKEGGIAYYDSDVGLLLYNMEGIHRTAPSILPTKYHWYDSEELKLAKYKV